MPIAQPDNVSTTPGTPVKIPVLGNDTGTELTIIGMSHPSFGAVSLNPDQTLTYTPGSGFMGADGFTYTVRDAIGDTATASVSVTVAAQNRPPTALDDEAVMVPGAIATIPVIANDNDPDNDRLVISALEMPLHGSISVEKDQTLRYAAPGGFAGTEKFAYTVSDGRGGSATATVRVTVAALGKAPVAHDDHVTIFAGTAVIIEVLSNDQDPDGDPLAISALTLPACGTVGVLEGQRLLYTPGDGFIGREAFTYTVSDGRGGSAQGKVTIDVVAPNLMPVLASDEATTEAGKPVIIDILANDTDPEGGPLNLVALELPLDGTLVVNPDRTVTYTPKAGFVGTDQFTYRLADNAGAEAAAVVAIEVTEPAEPTTYLNGYAYRRRIVVPKGAVTGSHSGFPLLLRESGDWLKSASQNGRIVSPNGFDLRFELEDGTKLEHDIEHYDPVQGTLVAWIRLPQISDAADTSFHLYYGKTGLAISEQDPARVWRDYLAVWHLPDGTDRSGKGRHLTATDVASSQGMAGAAADFNGETSELALADASWLDGHSAVTAQLWLKSDRLDSDRGALVVGPVTGKDADSGLVIRHSATGFRCGLPRCFVIEHAVYETARDRVMRHRLEGPANSANDQPTSLAFEWSSGVLPKLALNGAMVEAAAIDGSGYAGTTRFNLGGLRIGTGSREPVATLGGKWDGLIDEVRFRATALSEAWLAVEHANQQEPRAFYGLGGEECFTQPGTAPVAIPVWSSATAGSSVLIDILAMIPGGTGCTLIAVGTPSAGTAVIESGKIRYTPSVGHSGADCFTYTVTKASATSTAMINLDVKPATVTSSNVAYGGKWWGCMEVFDNAANINTKNRAALAWTCRYSGRIKAWRTWIKRRPTNNTSSDYSRGDGGKYRFYLYDCTTTNGKHQRSGNALGRTNINGGYTAPLAVNISGKTPVDGWRNYDVPEFLTFTFENPVPVQAGKRYWLELKNETAGSGHSAWDNCIVEQKFPKELTSGLYFAGDEFYIDDSGNGSWIQKTYSRGPNEAIYEDGIVEGTYISSAGAGGRIDLTSTRRIRQCFRLPQPITVDAVTARIYYKGGVPGPLVVTLTEGTKEIFLQRLTPYPYQKLPPSWPGDRPSYATEERGFEIPCPWPAVPWVAPLGKTYTLSAGKDYALTIHAESGTYRVGQMSVWPGPNIDKSWTPDKAGCQLRISTDSGVSWQGNNNQITLALRRVG